MARVTGRHPSRGRARDIEGVLSPASTSRTLTHSACLVPDGNGLQLEMAAAQQCCCSDELARGQVLGSEVGAIDAVEFVEEREVRAGNLHVDQIVHGHTSLLESGLNLVEQDLDFVVDFGGRLARLVQADAPCQVQRIAGQNGVTEWQLRIGVGKVNSAAAGLRGRLGKRATHGKQSRGGKYQEYETCSSIQRGPTVASHRVLRCSGLRAAPAR